MNWYMTKNLILVSCLVTKLNFDFILSMSSSPPLTWKQVNSSTVNFPTFLQETRGFEGNKEEKNAMMVKNNDGRCSRLSKSMGERECWESDF